MRNSLKKEKGVTLIVLAVTTIVLMILLGISLGKALTEEKNLIGQASEASESSRAYKVKEYLETAETINSSNSIKTKEKLVAELYEKKLLTSEEAGKLETEDTITIARTKINFRNLPSANKSTISNIFSNDMVGQSIEYSAQGQSDWIILGKTNGGEILMSTKKPIENAFELNGSAQDWLKYEENINNICSQYSGKLQGINVYARSITLEDINDILGFELPEFDIYNAGAQATNHAQKILKCFYPSVKSSTYWATSVENPTTFKNGALNYNESMYRYSETGFIDVSLPKPLNNELVSYILGEEEAYEYLIGSKTTFISSLGEIFFRVGMAKQRNINTNLHTLCSSTSSVYNEAGNIGTFAIRPVITIPDIVKVEKNQNGKWNIME